MSFSPSSTSTPSFYDGVVFKYFAKTDKTCLWIWILPSSSGCLLCRFLCSAFVPCCAFKCCTVRPAGICRHLRSSAEPVLPLRPIVSTAALQPMWSYIGPLQLRRRPRHVIKCPTFGVLFVGPSTWTSTSDWDKTHPFSSSGSDFGVSSPACPRRRVLCRRRVLWDSAVQLCRGNAPAVCLPPAARPVSSSAVIQAFSLAKHRTDLASSGFWSPFRSVPFSYAIRGFFCYSSSTPSK